MSAFALKIIALTAMLIDHMGAVFFPDQIWMRYVGRLSFPIFAFLLAEGFIHTSDRRKYSLRLFLFALVSEIPYDLLFHGTPFFTGSQNIMFELLFGFFVLLCAEKSGIFAAASDSGNPPAAAKKEYIYILPVLALILLAEFMDFSYGVYGIVLILTFYIFRKDKAAAALASAAVSLLFNGIGNVSFVLFGKTMTLLSLNTIQVWAGLAALPVFFYNGKKGKYSLKWLFYIIYPLHMLTFYMMFIALNL